MLVSVTAGADASRVGRELVRRGLWVKRLENDGGVHFVVAAHSAGVEGDAIRAIDGVSDIAMPSSAHPLVDAQGSVVEVGGLAVGKGAPPAILAGPCSVESEEQIHAVAARVAAAGATLLRGGAYKPRTSPYAFQGHGRPALEWMAAAARAHGLGVVTEVLDPGDADAVAEYADLLQIGSRNMHNHALLRAAAATGKPILLKRGMSATVEEWMCAGEVCLLHGASGVIFCERGIRGFDPSTRNVLDLGAVALLVHAHDLPVIVDPSHATGRRDLIPALARGALGAGAHGLLLETHDDPGAALSDGPQALRPDEFATLVGSLTRAARPTTGAPPVTRTPAKTSRLPGFYRHDLPRRLDLIRSVAGLSDEAQAHLSEGGGITPNVADLLSENVIATHGLPLSVAVNFRVNGRDVLVPMAVEEPSVVAAASNAARIARLCGGFAGEADAPVMTAQVQLDHVPNAADAPATIEAAKAALLALGDDAIPRMVARGGGCRDLEVRVLCEDTGVVVVDVYVDVRDAMGANIVDSVAEAMAPGVQELVGGDIGLRILSNLPLRRTVKVSTRLSLDAVGGRELAEGVVRASRFAELDARRAVTHNKGIMNGVDSVAVALGQDWRSIEAGAHAFAGMGDGYRPLAVWHIDDEDRLVGELVMPMAVGTVGGSTRAHNGVRAAFEIVGITDAGELGIVMAAAGLASNLAALRALAGEGIQKGHMRLHHRKSAAVRDRETEGVESATGSLR